MMKSSTKTHVFETIAGYRQWRASLIADSDRPLVGLVPTMGALHDGHISLVQRAASECQNVVVSVFVNPLQFGPNEDFDRYPRQFPADLEKCQDAGVHAIFHPSVQEFYGKELVETTRVVPPPALINHLCGAFRPGHFEGVTTVVMKLFGVTQANRAYFGEKDYQQLAVIKRMVKDLNFPIDVVGVPTVREPDGLALSSRNVYIEARHRGLAPKLHEALCFVRDQSLSGEMSLPDALRAAEAQLRVIPDLTLQYLQACDADTLVPLNEARRPMVILLAAKLGNVRLIDNVVAV